MVAKERLIMRVKLDLERKGVDNIFSLTEIIQGRMREGQSTTLFS